MAEKKVTTKSLYSVDEVVSVAGSIQNRISPPKTKKGKELYTALEPFIEKKATPAPIQGKEDRINRASVFVVKFYDKDGEVITASKNVLSSYWEDNVFEFMFIKEQAQKYPPMNAVICRIFASYDGRTLDPVPVDEFSIYELDLSTPDFPVEEED